MWTLVKNDFNDIELVRNDSYEGEVERIEMSNNENFVKVNTYLGSKLLHVGKFDWKANDFAGQFKNNLGGRSSFLKKWKELDPASVSDGNLRIDHTKRRFVSENTSKHESNPTPKNNSPATQKKDFKSRKEVPREVEKSMTDTYNSITEDSMHDTTDTKEREEKGFLEELKKRFKGYYRLHVTDLAEPSFCHSVRQPDPKHIKELETEFKENPHNHYTMMVVNIPGATEFPDNLFDGKSVFETIGGNHSRIALQNILKDKDVINKEDFQERMCAVYCNLSPEQSKRIGMDHNAIHKFGKELNYFSRVQCFRNTLFQEAGMVGKVDPLSKATPKDSEIISVWKKQLEAITGAKNRKDMNNKYRQDIRLAQLETKCWVQMTQFVELFEKNKGKTISGRQLRCVDGLTEDQLISILQEYNNDKLDFNQFKSRCQALQGSKIETKRHKISKDQSKTDADKNQEATCGEHNGDSQCITDLSKETEIKRQAKELEKKIEWLEEENSNLQHQLEDSKIQLECKCKELLECQKELAVCKEENKKKLLQIEDSKRKISKLYEESKRFTINEQKRKASETVTQFAEKLARDVELNPSPKKKLSLERLEVNFEKGEAIEALWKNDNHWYDAVIIEKRKNGYYVQFTMDKIKSVVKECNIRKKHVKNN